MTELRHNDFLLEVAKGKIPKHSLVHKFGRNNGVPNGSFEMISLLSSAASFLQAATTVRVKAGNAADADGLAGAQTVFIQGIDSNLAVVSETLTTAGASASSNSSNSYWRIFRAYVASCGTYGAANTGDVIIENSAGGTDLIKILAAEGQTQHGAYTVPTGHTAYLYGALITVDAAKAADIRLCIRLNFNDVTTPFSPLRVQNYWDGVLGDMTFDPVAPIKFDALTDIWFEAQGGGAGTEVSVDFPIVLVQD